VTFVFSIIGEEYGFIGTIIFLALFLTILLRGFKIAKNAPDEFGRYLAIGNNIHHVVYALGNALVTLGIFPTTGLPMPFCQLRRFRDRVLILCGWCAAKYFFAYGPASSTGTCSGGIARGGVQRTGQ